MIVPRLHPVRRPVLERLRALQHQQELAQAEATGILQGLAAALDVDPGTIVGWEDGDTCGVLVQAPDPPPEPEPPPPEAATEQPA
jgi:hypothetical protein